MSQTKAQLVTPLAAAGIVTAAGVVATGVVTATSFDGDVVGSATSIISGGNLNVGIISATNFSGDFTGSATGIQTGAAIKVGSFTASSFAGDFTGTATSMMRGTGFKAGVVNATGFVANVTGNITGDVTGNVGGDVTGNVEGNVTGNVVGTAGSVASGSNIHVGVMTATSYSGNGSNLSGIAATTFTTQVVTANGSETIIDLSDGNCITMNQSANTTVGFASTSTAMAVTIIRIKDSNSTARTITWPSNVYWNGGSAPTLITNNNIGDDNQQFEFITRDSGLTWYAWEPFKFDQLSFELWSWGRNFQGSLGLNGVISRSSPTQIDGRWSRVSSSVGGGEMALKYDGSLWTWGQNEYGNLGHNTRPPTPYLSSPTQVGTDTTWGPGLGNGGNGAFQMAVKTDGTLWSWGAGNAGQTAQNDNVKRSSPTQVGTDTTWGTSASQLHGNFNCGAIKQDGTLWTWGEDNQGLLGHNQGPVNKSSPTQVGSGTDWSYIGGSTPEQLFMAKTDGTLWACGYNNTGQLGLNDKTSRSSPSQIPGTTWKYAEPYGDGTLAIKTDGTLWFFGRNQYGLAALNTGAPSYRRSSPVQIPGTTWGDIRLSSQSAHATKTDGTLWAWGYQNHGGLGLNQGPGAQLSSPTQIPGTWESLSRVSTMGRNWKIVAKTES